MATVEDLIKQYQTDESFRKEVAEVLADGRITPQEFMAFAKRHGVKVSLMEIPGYIQKAKEAGLIK